MVHNGSIISECPGQLRSNLHADHLQGIREPKWRSMHVSSSMLSSRPASAIRKTRGSAAPTRTPMRCCVSTSRKADLNAHSAEGIAAVAATLNARPEKKWVKRSRIGLDEWLP